MKLIHLRIAVELHCSIARLLLINYNLLFEKKKLFVEQNAFPIFYF